MKKFGKNAGFLSESVVPWYHIQRRERNALRGKHTGKHAGQVVIECPNTIFHLYVKDEVALSKIEVFMRNIRTVDRLGLIDIYNWCNRQGIAYDTRFNYHKGMPGWKNVRSYVLYSREKMKYQVRLGTI